MIRPILPADTPGLLQLAEQTGVFKPLEVQTFGEVIDDYYDYTQAMGDRAVTYARDAKLLGFAYYATEDMTDRTWNLWWIIVAKECQSAGIGSHLLRHAEDDIRGQQGRVLFIETSSLPQYEPSRRFYTKHGYAQVALLPDYYTDGDDMLVFRKRLAP
jgi:ribosomal protein S18 acetylase RimI-like enzyme